MSGFIPVGTTDGSDYHAKMRDVYFDPTDTDDAFQGDMVSIVDGGSSPDGRAETVEVATAGAFANGTTTAVVGAIVGFTPDFTDEGSLIRNYHAGSTGQKAKMVYGKDVIFQAETASALTAANVNNSCNINVANDGNTQSGISGMRIGAIGTPAATDQLRLLGYARTEGEAIALGTIGAQWLCRLNNSADDHGLVGVS